MKKFFTLALVMAIAIAGFAQVKSARPDFRKMTPVQKKTVSGTEAVTSMNLTPSTRSIMTIDPEEVELNYTTYDWQTNAAQRNFTAVWPDGFAVMCYTMATTDDFSDRGTGLAIWDPAVGEWEYTEERIEDIKTGFGSIARWKENGLVVASHSANECHLWFCENFKNGSREFEMVTIPNDLEPTWPSIQCSGENLDIVHVIATQYTSLDPFDDALRYYRYENGNFTVSGELLQAFSADEMGGGGSNIAYFMDYNPAKPNRVAFIINDAWTDGKAVISEDNGATWSERVYFQHPGIHTTFEKIFYYPRWVDAEFDADDNLNIVYEYNGSTGEPGSGSYYPGLGGVAFWSETLPLNDSCVGGIGNHGEPFIMDTNYIANDLYGSCWYWSNAEHSPVPEHIGMYQVLDENFQVYPWDEELPEVYYWLDLDLTQEGESHGKYNNGTVAFPSMHRDGDKVFVVYSMLAGNSTDVYCANGLHYFRLFCDMSNDGGLTWEGPKQVFAENVMTMFAEAVYGQLIPYIYTDTEGDYMWYCYQRDENPGSFVQDEDEDSSDNCYMAVKIYVDYMDVEENTMTVGQMINVYPNPAQGSFNVSLTNASDVNIYNAVGQLVKTYNNVTEMSVNLESGVYFVNAGNQTVKVVVK